ncbi:MAG: hypothetical protein E6I78_08655 [Chloroflexi bacterium]|nr:MAG: hypothetical protein E6I78_08655 [Chloroflexota bacterium]
MTSKVLLFGNPVSGSLSPVMQNAAFAALGIECLYELREVDAGGLPGAIAELRGDERIVGANVTIPHKEAVIALLDDLDPQAARIGAVNTISRHKRLEYRRRRIPSRHKGEISLPRYGRELKISLPLWGRAGWEPSRCDYRSRRRRTCGCGGRATNGRRGLGDRAESRAGTTSMHGSRH